MLLSDAVPFSCDGEVRTVRPGHSDARCDDVAGVAVYVDEFCMGKHVVNRLNVSAMVRAFFADSGNVCVQGVQFDQRSKGLASRPLSTGETLEKRLGIDVLIDPAIGAEPIAERLLPFEVVAGCGSSVELRRESHEEFGFGRDEDTRMGGENRLEKGGPGARGSDDEEEASVERGQCRAFG